jgi:hypothetical protein
MKLSLEKLGRIERAEIEIRPLTVLVGANNTNKTWAAYALYGLLRYLTWRKPAVAGVRSYGSSLMEIQSPSVRERVLAAVEEAIDRMPKGEADTAVLDISRQSLIREVHEPVRFTLKAEQLRSLLGLEGELDDDVRATLEVPEEQFLERNGKVRLQLEYAQRSLLMHWIDEKPEIKLSMQRSAEDSPEDLRHQAKRLMRAFAQRFLSMNVVLPLPATRKALGSLYRHIPDRAALGSSMEEPVADFIDYLRTVDALWQTRKEVAMPAALDMLEAQILGGSVQFQQRGPLYRLAFQPRGGPALPMHATSSIVRSLSSLDLYLRYTAREGDTLIIDEPEMNAHPDAQIRVTELLAYLVNKGVRVVLTTQSPYIVDHLNNLMAAKKLSPSDQEAAAKEFKLGSQECFLSAEQVAAYLFESESDKAPVQVNQVPRGDDPVGLFDWETFSRSARFLGHVYSSEILPHLDPEV